MSKSISFAFEGKSVRVISDDIFNPLFVAYDVATALGYKKPENAIARHCKRQATTPKQGGGFLTVIPESDLYRLVFRSKLESAEVFTNWVVEEVIPTIRKTGSYNTFTNSDKSTLSTVTDRIPLKIAVNKLAAAAHITFRDAYMMVHQQFAIKSVEELTAAQIPEAVEYVHGLTLSCCQTLLSGDLLPKEEDGKFVPLDDLKNIEMWRRVGYDSYRFQIGKLRTLEDKLDECRHLLDSAKRNAAVFHDSVTECCRIPLSADQNRKCAERASRISAKYAPLA